jgi:hypothetical protein
MGKRLIVWMVAQAFGWVILLKHGDVVNMTGSLPDTINDIGVMFLMCQHDLFMRHFSEADHFADPYVALYMGVVLVMAATINNFLLAAICDGFTAAVGSCFHPPGLLKRERERESCGLLPSTRVAAYTRPLWRWDADGRAAIRER